MVAEMVSSIQPTDRASYVRSGFVVAATLVLVVAVTAAVITDDAPTPRPQLLAGAAANGRIAYSYAGDIYVGDPATGETTAIVTNPIYEVNPMFSPDGERIAFIRGDPQTGESTIVVVRADGSDERVLLPKGREHRGFGSIAWTPDGDSLLVQLDTPPFTYPHDDGKLSLFDSSGTLQWPVSWFSYPCVERRILSTRDEGASPSLGDEGCWQRHSCSSARSLDLRPCPREDAHSGVPNEAC